MKLFSLFFMLSITLVNMSLLGSKKTVTFNDLNGKKNHLSKTEDNAAKLASDLKRLKLYNVALAYKRISLNDQIDSLNSGSELENLLTKLKENAAEFDEINKQISKVQRHIEQLNTKSNN